MARGGGLEKMFANIYLRICSDNQKAEFGFGDLDLDLDRGKKCLDLRFRNVFFHEF